MSKRRMVLLRTAGIVIGLLVVGVAVEVALFPWLSEDSFLTALALMGGVVVGTVGAAVGATVTQRLLRRRSSFCRALLGAIVGLVVGAVCSQVLILAFNRQDLNDESGLGYLATLAAIIILLAAIVAGAVIGSGWKAKPRDAASPSA
jgi:CDP-diglyceride synthetase